MWLATKLGFYSIVRKDDGVHVRSRVLQDLQNLVSAAGLRQEIQTWPAADHRFRIIISSEQLARVMTALTNSIDYSNFKSMIGNTPDQKGKSKAYGSIWSTMYALQDSEPHGA
ncbi:MAG: hypothetical protein K1X75_16350 [Leptospirales bacterium]|nr:hypothetical protein [Leptospirales bacterium]